VIVLEAGPRVGGRVWTRQLSDGTPFDIGGAWVADAAHQPNIRKLMQELGVGVYRQPDSGINVFVDAKGKVSQYDSQDPVDPLPAIGLAGKVDLAAAIFNLDQMSEVVHLDSPWDDVDFPPLLIVGPKTTLEADTFSIENWLELNMHVPAAKAILRTALAGVFGLDTWAVSLLHLLFFLRSFGGFANSIGTGPGQADEFRVRGGAQEAAKRIAAILGPQAVRLNSPVRQINQDANGVVVTSDTVSVHARRVIVAIPISLTNFIRFLPILPPDRAQLQQRFPQGSVWKIWLVYDEAFWRKRGLSGETVSIDPNDFVPNTRDAGLDAAHNQPGLLNAFVVGDKAREFNRWSRAQRKARIIQEMVHRFGQQAAQLSTLVLFPAVPPANPVPDSYFEYNWSIEEWARGDFAAAPGPGVLTGFGFGPAIREPFRRIHWAGVDTATFPLASFSGAARAGERAAAEVLAAG
jgi:monoamine oxidase